ncbi:MAG: nickel-dependent hydrogenase large subunit [Desulfobulbaceae bacterium]|nr:nickel-dependent hydrogenase large subunit [Desulfobulbaceae bacterium]MCK5403988.1 nickel-dependent hydrogenase large subunit [Desulfobulbaceae bacterium]
MKVDLGPVTRLEGHLNVKTTITDNTVKDAKCMGEMFRGFEVFLRGRDPMDAQQITQRICGVCPYAHGIASSYAQENAYNLTVPPNGRILHNLVQGANHLYDYLLHFYQLSALDFVDVTAILQYKGNDTDLTGLRDWVKAELASGKAYPAAPFLPRLSGAYIEDPEINIGALKHYLESMEIQKKANRASAIFGGKFPHATALFPGGCPQPATIDLITQYQALILEVKNFYHQKYIPDIVAVATAFPEYWDIGRSKGGFLSYGLLPLGPDRNSRRLFAPGMLYDGKISKVDFESITEDVRYSKYSSPTGLPVKDGQLEPAPHKNSAYSWIKAPRYDGKMVEVGPAARVLVDYMQGNNSKAKELVNHFAGVAGIKAEQLNSVLGRHLCRAICGVVIADFLLEETERLDPSGPTMPEINIPATGEGFGATEASRGALLHYIRLENHKIDKYECVVPTTWNCSPQDDNDRPGALESALIGTHVEDPEDQIESVRIVHSFDPCLACAVH